MTQTPSNLDSNRIPVNVVQRTSATSGIGQSNEKADNNGQDSTEKNLPVTEQRLVKFLDLAVATSGSLDVLLTNLTRIVSDESDCLALWAFQAKPAEKEPEAEANAAAVDYGQPHLLTKSILPESESVYPIVEEQVTHLIACANKSKSIYASPASSNTELIVAPIVIGAGDEAVIPLMLAGSFATGNQSSLRQQWLLGFVSKSIAGWFQHRNLIQQEHKTRSLNDTIGLVHSLDQTKTIPQASMVIVNHLRRLCDAEQVALSFCESAKTGTLKAISDVEQIDLSSESNKIVINACNQAILEGKPLCFPSPEGENSPALLALESYCNVNGHEACVNIPLVVDEGTRTIGSVLVAATQEQIANEHSQNYLGRMVQMSSGHLDVVMRANRGVRDIVKSKLLSFRKSKFTKTCLIGFAAAALLLCVPLPYRVGCDCEVQPVLRRFVASPHDGILEKTFVESGDIVEANQIVAHLDGRQMRIELSVLRAELAGAKKRHDSSLAQGDVAASHIARSEMKRHQSKIEILEQQVTNLEVRTPIAGIVVSGDLEKVQGAPLEMGQTLFEIAPLDEMVAEIGIPESEIRYVKPGMTVGIKLDSFPFKTWKGTVEKIHPRNEIINDESVFVAQVVLDNDAQQLRPGMQGSAKISTSMSPIGWNLFHTSWEAVRYWMIW